MAVDTQNTTFSDIDLAFVKHFLRIEPDMTEDDVELSVVIEAAKAFVLDHTQMTVEELDAAKSANILYLKLISDLYHNRSATGGGAIEPIFEIVFKNLRKLSL
jgi:hypothetical protein